MVLLLMLWLLASQCEDPRAKECPLGLPPKVEKQKPRELESWEI